ncbi:MAG: hypothetical protein ACOC8C_01260 [Chloroflexota bacterium]
MTPTWLHAFRELQRFIDDHPSVEITDNLVSLDESVRPQFFELFDQVRHAFLFEHLPAFMEEAEALGPAYRKAERELVQRLGITDVLMPAEVRRFLEDPTDQLSRELFDLVFELLRENIEPEEFEEHGLALTQYAVERLYGHAYNKWATLELALAFEPEKIFEVPLPEPTSKQIVKHRPGQRLAVPVPSLATQLAFEVKRASVLLAPDFILRSALLDAYVAFRTALGRARWAAAGYPAGREWLNLEDMMETYGTLDLDPGLLLYVDDNLQDIALVADAEMFCRPDLCVYFPEKIGPASKSYFDEAREINLCHIVLKPVRASVVLAKDSVLDAMAENLVESVERFTFGPQHTQLEPVLDLIE